MKKLLLGMDAENDTSPIFSTGHYTTYKSVRNLDRKSPYSFNHSHNSIDRPVSTTNIERPGSKSNLAALKENNFPPQKKTFSRLYNELCPNEALREDVTPYQFGSNFEVNVRKPSDDFLPKIKKNDVSINDSKAFKSILKAHKENEPQSSSRDTTKRKKKFSFDVSETSKPNGKALQKQKTVVFAQNANDDSFVSTDQKENKIEPVTSSYASSKNVVYPSVYQRKKETATTTMKTKDLFIPQSGSAAMFVEKRSYFNKLKVDVGDEKYLKSQNLLSSKFIEMREKLASLKDAIANS